MINNYEKNYTCIHIITLYNCEGVKVPCFLLSLYLSLSKIVQNKYQLESHIKLFSPGSSYQVNMSSSCPRGWTWFYRRCFVYIPRAMSWAHCSVSQDFGQAKSFGLPEIMLSTSVFQENVWLWNDGSHFRYTHWRPGEPSNGYGKQYCLQINYSCNSEYNI